MKYLSAFHSKKNMLLLYSLIALVVSIHRYLLGQDHINNFIIFKNSFQLLQNGDNLYAPHPDLYFDLYKYSPSFASMMFVFAFIPIVLSYCLWNLVNALMLFFSIWSLPIKSDSKSFILLFCIPELIPSLQNSQSNGLVAGLLVYSFSMIIHSNYFIHSLTVITGFFIKIFGAFGGLFYLFSRNNTKTLLYYGIWFVLISALPLLFTSYENLIAQYQNWFALLKSDPAHELNFSVMSVFHKWFKVICNDTYFQLIGMLLLLAPLIKFNQVKLLHEQLLYLSVVMLWVVLFNHKAESPTFIIAVTGIAIGLTVIASRKTKWILGLLVLLFTSLSSSDIFPRYIRTTVFIPYAVKAIPCIICFAYYYTLLFKSLFLKQYTAIRMN